MDSKSVVTVSRKWNEPNIIVWVNNEGIGMGMKMDDYLVALSEVIGNPLFVLTKAQMLQKMREASPAVESEMKDATLKVAF
jgi:hypothetical protein